MTALTVLTLGLTLGLALLVRFDPTTPRELAAMTLLGACVPVFAPLLCRKIGTARTGPGPRHRYLTATTITGPRNVDLSNLVRIQRVTIPGKFGNSIDLLVVTDSHRVRIGLVSPTARAAVTQALRSTDPTTPSTTPKITSRAQRALGQSRPFSIVWDFTVPLMLSCLWILTVSVICISIAMT